MSTSTPTVERITCEDVQVGDRIARAKTHKFQEVVHITEGPEARRLFFTYSQENRAGYSRSRRPGKWWGINIRPQRTSKLWREVKVDEEAPRYRIDTVITVNLTRCDAEVSSTTLSEIQDAIRERLEGDGSIEFTVGLGGGEYGQGTMQVDGVEAKARRID